MEINIKQNQNDRTSYDLYVNGELEIAGESMQLIDNVILALQQNVQYPITECEEIALEIINNLRSVAFPTKTDA